MNRNKSKIFLIKYNITHYNINFISKFVDNYTKLYIFLKTNKKSLFINYFNYSYFSPFIQNL